MENKGNKDELSTFRQKRIVELENEAVVQRKIAEAIKGSETRYRRLFETAKDGILILDADTGEVTDVNPFLTDLLGYSREELVGKRLWEIGLFKDIEVSKTAFQELQKKEYIRYEHLPLESKDRKRLDVEFVSNVYLVNHKKVIQCNIRDITERKLTEEALRKSNAFNKSIIDSSNDCLKILDLEGRLQYMSPGGQHLLGIKDMGKYLNLPYQEFWKGTDHLAALDAIHKAQQGHPGTFQGYCPTADGTPKWWDVAITPVLGADGKPKLLLAVSRDITERKKMEEMLQHQAYHDSLTDLPNRALFIEHVTLELTHARRNQRKVAVLFFDLDRFKNINDSMGHAAGDELLRKVAGRLKSCMRESDSIARMGGDEFVMLLTDIVHIGDISKVAEKIISAFSEPFAVHNKELYITTSIGISVYPDGGQTAEDLMKNADKAMYQVKEQGRNNYQFYVP